MKRRNQIHHKVLQFLKRTDWQLLPPVAGVLAFGWWVQWSVAGGDVFPNGHTIRLLATGLALILAAGWSARRRRNRQGWWRRVRYPARHAGHPGLRIVGEPTERSGPQAKARIHGGNDDQR